MRPFLVLPWALSLILLPDHFLVSAESGPFPDFRSAQVFRDFRGLCNVLFAEGEGLDRKEFLTNEAVCNDHKQMSLKCIYTSPTFGDDMARIYRCDFHPQQECVMHDLVVAITKRGDAGCITPEDPQGDNVVGDYACTTRIRPFVDMKIASTVVTDDPHEQNLIAQCSLLEGYGDSDDLQPPPFTSTQPCDGANTVIVQLLKDHYYKACIFVGTAIFEHIHFHWTIRPQSITAKRDAESRPLSELIMMDDSAPSAEGARIEIL